MKIVNSLKSLKGRHRDNRVIRRLRRAPALDVGTVPGGRALHTSPTSEATERREIYRLDSSFQKAT
jgi:hypothetical protein